VCSEVTCIGLRLKFLRNLPLRLAVVKLCRPPIKSLTLIFSFFEGLMSKSDFMCPLKGLADSTIDCNRAALLFRRC